MLTAEQRPYTVYTEMHYMCIENYFIVKSDNRCALLEKLLFVSISSSFTWKVDVICKSRTDIPAEKVKVLISIEL